MRKFKFIMDQKVSLELNLSFIFRLNISYLCLCVDVRIKESIYLNVTSYRSQNSLSVLEKRESKP